MKMQNTEMEFVTFDAQDVIATSGGPNPYFSGEIMSYGTTTTFNDNPYVFYLVKTDDNKGNIAINTTGSTIDKTNGTTYYTLNSASSFYSGKYYTINATGTNDQPTSGDYLDDLGKILDWLTTNAQ